MNQVSFLRKRREETVEELLAIPCMHPGSINEQYVRGHSAGKPVMRGPYPVLCWREGKKVFSTRLTDERKLEQARQDVANHRRFKELCREFEALTQRLGQLEREAETCQEQPFLRDCPLQP